MAKPAKTDRQAVIDSIRKQQKGAEKRKGMAIVGVCIVIAVLIIGAAAYQPIKNWWELRGFNDLNLSEIGAATGVCQKIDTKKATGSQDHVQPGTPIPYEDAPPAFGTHYDVWDGIERKLYTADDRPDVGELVHNLEHGYTILWYDETIADDDRPDADAAGHRRQVHRRRQPALEVQGRAVDGVRRRPRSPTASTSPSRTGRSAAPATSEQVGVWQYCSETSGEALETFMTDYPYTDSPEPNAV